MSGLSRKKTADVADGANTKSASALLASSMHSFKPVEIEADQFKHVSIRASAGSGKTFQLTNRYLQLVAAGAEPRSILATTFTRLAAGQIRDRILMRLADAIDDETKRRDLAKHLGVKSISRAALQSILAHLARRLHQMQVRTLDSFFAAVVQAFAIELDMPLGGRVVDEAEARSMRAEAIRLMLDERQPQDLIELLRLLTLGSSERGVMKAIDYAVMGMLSLYREASGAEWECVPELPGTLSPPQLIDAIQFLHDTPPTTDSRQLKAHAADGERARQWNWGNFICNGLVKPILNGSCAYYNKPIDAKVVRAYEPLIAHARAELVGRVRDQTIATRDLLRLYQQQYEKVKHCQRAVTFDDLAAAMIRAHQAGELDAIGFRLDATLRHLLLDEFQDTSVSQWRALHPIAHELVSNEYPERSFFCVGDVKQSVYGWRDAAPEVLDDLPRLLGGAIDERQLAKSYRSSQPVIDVVNRVFESFDQNVALNEFTEAREAWRAGFTHHETDKTELAGYVELRTARRAEDDEQKNAIRFGAAADLATEIHQKNQRASIAILTRTNKAVAWLMYELGPSRRNIDGGVSGRGGVPLTDAPAVNAILDLLHLADHPDDTIAAFHVANSPLGQTIGLTDHRDHFRRHDLARLVRSQLMEDGYGGTIARWTQQIADACDAREVRRVLQLVELASAHDEASAAGGTLRTDDFIDAVAKTDIGDAQPAAVQVMTVHQSKGLEFDVVILPELESKLTGAGNPPVVFDREGGAGPITQICRYMKKETLALVPQLHPLFARHERRTVRESLSLLYVAMTRAIHGLYMIVDPPSLNKDGSTSAAGLKSAAGVLRCALAPDDTEPDRIIFSHGDCDWTRKAKQKVQSPKSKSQISEVRPILAPSQPGDAWRRRGAAAAAASHRLDAEVDGPQGSFMQLASPEARERGIALHRLFEQIEWMEDFSPDEGELLRLVRARFPRRDDAWGRGVVQSFLKAFKQDCVRENLSCGNLKPELIQLRRECPFARLVDGKGGGIQTGVIDRLVIEFDAGGSIRGATIIDFKTDAIDTAKAKDYAARYCAQMETYRAAVAEMLGLPNQSISVHLLFVAAGVAIEM